MKQLSPKTLSFFFVALIIFNSCIKTGGPCEEAIDINTSSIVCTFKDSSGRYLYEVINPLYNKDSLKIFDQNGNQLRSGFQPNQIPNTSFNYYEISFGNIYNNTTDQASFSSELCKNFIIKYSYNEADTIQACFKSKKYKCGALFETLKVYHKRQLLTTVTNNAYAQITLIKP